MNRFNKNYIFLYLHAICAFLRRTRASFPYHYIITTAGVKCCLAAVIRLPVLDFSVVWKETSCLDIFERRISLNLALGGASSVARYIDIHEQTQLYN